MTNGSPGLFVPHSDLLQAAFAPFSRFNNVVTVEF